MYNSGLGSFFGCDVGRSQRHGIDALGLEMHADVDGDVLRHFVETTQKLAPGSKAVPIATAAEGVPHGTRAEYSFAHQNEF